MKQQKPSALSSLIFAAILFITLNSCDQLSRVSPESLAEGKNLFTEGKYTEAAKILGRYVSAFPKDASGHAYLGYALYYKYSGDYANGAPEVEDLQRSLKELDTAIELDSKHFAAYSQRGVVQETLGRMDAARNDFEKAIELNPSYEQTYFNRGYWHETNNNYPAAIADYRKYAGMSNDVKWKADAERRIGILETKMGLPKAAATASN